MHNRNCQIPGCPCYAIRKRYSHLFREPEPLATQSSSSSDSDAMTERRMKLRLPLSSDDASGVSHPHYHITKNTRPKRIYPKVKVQIRRSNSLELTPVVEGSESPFQTPRVGGTLLAETPIIDYRTRTPAYVVNRIFSPSDQIDPNWPSTCTLLHQRSISADNLPTLCLNDCPFTPSPIKETEDKFSVKRVHFVAVGKPELSTIGEKKNDSDSDDSNTLSRSNSLSEPYKSYLSGKGKVTRDSSEGYYSMTSDSTASPKRRLESNSSSSSVTVNERDSDAMTERRKRLRLPLGSDDASVVSHPHYYMTKDTSPIRLSSKVKVQRRHSNSLVDNLPTLCLNDCPFTPSPIKETEDKFSVKRVHFVAVGKPELSTIGEKKNASSTSSRSNSLSEPDKSYLSDNDEAIETDSYQGNRVKDSITLTRRDIGLVHWDTIRHRKVTRDVSEGYYSMTSDSTASLKHRLEPNSSSSSVTVNERDRSKSPPYTTVVTLSNDGSVLHITEC